MSSAYELRDWRERCYPEINLVSPLDVTESQIVSVGSPIMIIENHTGEVDDDKKYSVSSAFILLCPFQEAVQFNLLSFTDKSMKGFIAYSVTSLVVYNNEKCQNLSEFEQTRCSLVDFSSKSFVSSKTFWQRCQHAINMWKKLLKMYTLHL